MSSQPSFTDLSRGNRKQRFYRLLQRSLLSRSISRRNLRCTPRGLGGEKGSGSSDGFSPSCCFSMCHHDAWFALKCLLIRAGKFLLREDLLPRFQDWSQLPCDVFYYGAETSEIRRWGALFPATEFCYPQRGFTIYFAFLLRSSSVCDSSGAQPWHLLRSWIAESFPDFPGRIVLWA
jgi:hypothetical protein